MFSQIMKFGSIGILNTFLDFAVFNLLIWFFQATDPMTIFILNTVAVSIAILNSYLCNRYWTFKWREGKTFVRLHRFILVSAGGLIINSLVVYWMSSFIIEYGNPYIWLNLAKISAALLSSSWNFFLYRNWVFKPVHPPVLPGRRPLVERGLVSIVIPAFNESSRLPKRLVTLAESLPKYFPLEILVVDDGSQDVTPDLVNQIASQYSFIRLISYIPNQGKGKAVQTGMLTATGEHVIFCDADDTYTPRHIIQVAKELLQGKEIVIASRSMKKLHRLEKESWWRCLQGKLFNRLVQALLLPGLKDTQCGLKGFSRSAVDKLFPLQRTCGFAFDVEILCLAKHMGLNISELEVDAADCEGSRVHKILSPIQMGIDIFKIKLAFLSNRYSLPRLSQNRPYRPWLAAGALFLAALMVRIPFLWEVPRFIDELREVRLAYMIYTGQMLPLHNVAHDIGSMHNYILAGLFALTGPNVYLPRLYAAVCSALTVVLIYLIGKHWYGKRVALIAAILLMVNGMNILTSHMAWANCTTPFFFSLALLALIKSEEKRSGTWLIISAFLWGLTLQTHSSVVIYILAVLVYIAWQYKTGFQLGLRYYALSALAFVLAYSNMIYFNIVSKGGSISWLSRKSYALESEPGLSSYLTNFGNMAAELIRVLSSTYNQQDQLTLYLTQPLFLTALLLLIYGAVLSYKCERKLPLLIIACGFLVMPWVNERYVFYVSTRYIMPIVLISILFVSLAMVSIYDKAAKSVRLPKIIEAPAALIILGSLLLAQLVPFYSYCNEIADSNQSNRITMQVFTTAMSLSGQNENKILLDNSIEIENDPLPDLFTLVRQPYEIFPFNNDSIDKLLNSANKSRNKGYIAITDQNYYRQLSKSVNPQDIYKFRCNLNLLEGQTGNREIYVIYVAPGR